MKLKLHWQIADRHCRWAGSPAGLSGDQSAGVRGSAYAVYDFFGTLFINGAEDADRAPHLRLVHHCRGWRALVRAVISGQTGRHHAAASMRSHHTVRPFWWACLWSTWCSPGLNWTGEPVRELTRARARLGYRCHRSADPPSGATGMTSDAGGHLHPRWYRPNIVGCRSQRRDAGHHLFLCAVRVFHDAAWTTTWPSRS